MDPFLQISDEHKIIFESTTVSWLFYNTLGFFGRGLDSIRVLSWGDIWLLMVIIVHFL